MPDSKSADNSKLRLRITYRATAELQRYPQNARVHGDDQIAALEASIRQFGFVNPLLVEADGTIVGGHGRLEAASRIGLTRLPVIELAHLNPAQAKALRLADNRLAEMATWDEKLLGDELAALADAPFNVTDFGFDMDEIRIDGVVDGKPEPKDQEPDPQDDAPEPPKEPTTRLGDVWMLGRHRVVCGNTLEDQTLERLLAGARADLVLTDPPYAIYGSSTGVSASVSDDKMVRPFFRDVLRLAQSHTRLFAHVYIFCDWRSWASWWEESKAGELTPKNLLVWDKNGAGLGANYANTYELIGFFANLPKQTSMRAGGKTGQRPVHQPNILRFPRVAGAERQHNAAKPVKLLEQLLSNSSDVGEMVLDLFGGSGSTLLAAEETKRVARLAEIEPKYVDVIVQRWEAKTGKQAKLEGSKKTFADVAAERKRRKGKSA